MKDEDKTKEQLLKQLAQLRQQIAELKRSETKRKKVEEALEKLKEELASRVKEHGKLEKLSQALKKELRERKKAEEALRELEEMYKILVKTSQEAVALHDMDTKIIEVSQRWLKLWGYESAEEVIGRDGFEFMDAKNHKKGIIDREHALKKCFLENLEYTFIRKDGTRFIGELNGSLIKDAYGIPKGFMATTRDITERKKMEDKMKQYS